MNTQDAQILGQADAHRLYSAPVATRGLADLRSSASAEMARFLVRAVTVLCRRIAQSLGVRFGAAAAPQIEDGVASIGAVGEDESRVRQAALEMSKSLNECVEAAVELLQHDPNAAVEFVVARRLGRLRVELTQQAQQAATRASDLGERIAALAARSGQNPEVIGELVKVSAETGRPTGLEPGGSSGLEPTVEACLDAQAARVEAERLSRSFLDHAVSFILADAHSGGEQVLWAVEAELGQLPADMGERMRSHVNAAVQLGREQHVLAGRQSLLSGIYSTKDNRVVPPGVDPGVEARQKPHT